jgi:hypothetical protein
MEASDKLHDPASELLRNNPPVGNSLDPKTDLLVMEKRRPFVAGIQTRVV